MLSKYPLFGPTNHLWHFQASWFQQFPGWLEYSLTVDATFCLPCYVFSCKPNNRFGANAFTVKEFQNWKKVNDGKKMCIIDVFTAAIDSQLQELNNIFNDTTMELLVLCSTLDPRDNYKLFKVDDICKLAAKFYPDDFTEQEKLYLRIQLQHYELDVPNHSELKKLLTIAELSHGLVKTEKYEIYHLVFKLIRLVLTLLVSTATIERSFLAMKFVKTRLRNKMEDEYLADYLVTYIEKRTAIQFSTYSIIDYFYDMKERRARLR
ncbi:Dimer_Tnp_hAT domain-containing protein [Cephalotus follicularis]|uniref:Dimer_Tnp_hAT domain-containing protein n=1 Tax=Cephalotus follicularis TaxID=3775 RepID=A0A1Q3BUU9_CEPFO|nr:Dimer_Tnp_hAT domain-containing protein [Cephalotus follicularis]